MFDQLYVFYPDGSCLHFKKDVLEARYKTSQDQCTCKGFSFRGVCRHVRMLSGVWVAGKMSLGTALMELMQKLHEMTGTPVIPAVYLSRQMERLDLKAPNRERALMVGIKNGITVYITPR